MDQGDFYGHDSARRVPAVDKAIAVLAAVSRARRPVTLGELSRSLGLPKSTAHGLCHTLVWHGYLRRLDSGFVIGHSVMPLANAYLETSSVAGEFALLWRELKPRPRHAIVLSMLAGRDVIYTAGRNVSILSVLRFAEGLRLPAHLCASGKAMLAWKPEAELAELFSQGPLARRTSAGPVTFSQLLADLHNVRVTGYSVDQGCVADDLVGFGAAVFDGAGDPVAGLGLVVGRDEASFEGDRHPRQVRDLATRLTCRLQGRIPVPAPG